MDEKTAARILQALFYDWNEDQVATIAGILPTFAYPEDFEFRRDDLLPKDFRFKIPDKQVAHPEIGLLEVRYV